MKRSRMEICADGVGPEPNWEGVAYYHAVLDELVNQGTAATAREQMNPSYVHTVSRSFYQCL